jgi:predicted lipoprotein with Yx(FWY)xxD motif
MLTLTIFHYPVIKRFCLVSFLVKKKKLATVSVFFFLQESSSLSQDGEKSLASVQGLTTHTQEKPQSGATSVEDACITINVPLILKVRDIFCGQNKNVQDF